MRGGITNAQAEKSNRIFRSGLVDKLEESFLVPDLSIREQQDFHIQILEAVLHRGLNRLIHFSAAHVGADGVDIFQGTLEVRSIVTLAFFPHERVTGAKRADVELNPDRERFQENFECGLKRLDVVVHTAAPFDDEY